MFSTDPGIQTTENCVFAVLLDMRKKTENILIGELKDIKRRLDGFSDVKLLYEKTRDLGRLIMDFTPIAEDLTNIRAVLLDSVTGSRSPYYDREIGNLERLYSSDNPIHRFTALLMWQEYQRYCLFGTKDSGALFDVFDDITLALRFNLIDNVKNWQEQNRKSPLAYLDNDFRKYPILLYYGSDKNASEYAVTDKSLLPIAVYYLKQVYGSGRYIQTCPACGNSFVAKTIGMTTFCSDKCRRVQGKESKRRFDERAREIPYERAYKNTYMYWYNKVKKCRDMDLPPYKMDKIETAFTTFSKESSKRKKAIRKDKDLASEYETWLLVQRDAIDDLLGKLKI